MNDENTKTVLIVDDNQSIRSIVYDFLRGRGVAVTVAADGIQGLERALSSPADVMILDVVMPGIDGFRLCQMIREKGITTPIIMLTEKTSIEDKVTGFSRGADDYLAKPFSPLELELRVQALIRRASGDGKQPSSGGLLRRGTVEIDLDRHTVTVDGKPIGLTPLEFDILKVLASTPGRVYSRQDLLNFIWDTAYEGYKRNIDPHVNRLRTKIEENPRKPKYVLTVWGIGYKFNEKLD
jgi:two-component system alkaline phosphatase synthesis response regulator PhoP